MTTDTKTFDRIAKLLEPKHLPRQFGLYIVGNYVAVNNGHEVYTLSSADLLSCLKEMGLEDSGAVVIDLEKREASLMALPIFMGRFLQDGNTLGL